MSVSAVIVKKLRQIEAKEKELVQLRKELEDLKKDTLRAQQMLEVGKAPRKRPAAAPKKAGADDAKKTKTSGSSTSSLSLPTAKTKATKKATN